MGEPQLSISGGKKTKIAGASCTANPTLILTFPLGSVPGAGATLRGVVGDIGEGVQSSMCCGAWVVKALAG